MHVFLILYMLCTHCTLVGITLIFIYVQSTEAYSKSSQTSKMELSCKKIVNGWKPLSIFAKSSKSSMLGAWLNVKYTSRLFSLQLPSLREKCPYSELFWSAFSRIRTEYSVSLRIQSECGKIWTRISPNTDTFYTVHIISG